MKRYFCPRIKYKSGSSAVLTTPLPAKRYAEEPFAVTVYTTWISESVGVAAGKLVNPEPSPVTAVAARVPVTFTPVLVVANFAPPL